MLSVCWSPACQSVWMHVCINEHFFGGETEDRRFNSHFVLFLLFNHRYFYRHICTVHFLWMLHDVWMKMQLYCFLQCCSPLRKQDGKLWLAVEHPVVSGALHLWLAHRLLLCRFLCAAQPLCCLLSWLYRTDQSSGTRGQTTLDLCSKHGGRKIHVLETWSHN